MNRRHDLVVSLGLTLCLGFAAPLPASAGLGDSALPKFADGSPSLLVLETTGIVKRGRLQTLFVCTSAAAEPIHLGVEVFDSNGVLLNDVGAGVGAVTAVAPGATVTIGTSTTASFLESTIIPLAPLSQGSARVVASATEVVCNVLVVDDAVTPPTTLATVAAALRPRAGVTIAGLVLPTFANGHAATHSMLVPGVVKRGRVESVFFCTSTAAIPIDVGVEILGQEGNLRNSINGGNGAVLGLMPGQTVTLGTTGTTAYLESTVIVMEGVGQGLARIVSTSPELLCTAMLLDSDGTPPVSMTGLGD